MITAERTKDATPHSSETGVPILMYHSVATDAHPRFRRWVVDPACFAAQLAHLAAGGYTPITVSHLRAAIAGDRVLPPRPVALTFDDGFADFHTTVLPQLQAHGFAATLYLTTHYLGGTSAWLRREGEADRPMLDWAQVRAIGAAGVELGAHTHTHPQLDLLPAPAARAEIMQPRQVIAAQTGITVESFAYPFGYYSAVSRRIVQAAGYTSAVAVKYALSGTDDDPFALSRLIVTADTSRASFAALLTTPTPWRARAAERARARVWQIARRLRHAVQDQIGAKRDA